MKKTPWFSKDVAPVHVGVYQVVCKQMVGTLPAYAFWDGYEFKSVAQTAYAAARATMRGLWMLDSSSKWRGLAENPHEADMKGVL